MELIKSIESILKEQKHSFRPIPIDIVIKNGNILLRSFFIYEIDKKNNFIKGLTLQEKYIHAREYRAPAYCIVELHEIKELNCRELDIFYINKKSVKADDLR